MLRGKTQEAEIKLYTSGEGHALQVGGLFAPLAQDARGFTVIFVQVALQLLASLSSDSVITPVLLRSVLSAQTRTEGVLPEAKAIEGEVAVSLFPAVSMPIELAGRSVTVPPPFGAVAFCQKYEKEVPVDTPPMLEIVEVYVLETPAVTVDGKTGPAVRSGIFVAGKVVQIISSLLYPVPTPFAA